MSSYTWLVVGFHPSEKYARQIEPFPQSLGWRYKKYVNCHQLDTENGLVFLNFWSEYWNPRTVLQYQSQQEHLFDASRIEAVSTSNQQNISQVTHTRFRIWWKWRFMKKWLVVSTPLKNIRQNGNLRQNRGENKKDLSCHHLEKEENIWNHLG